jgi:hypothetical protein
MITPATNTAPNIPPRTLPINVVEFITFAIGLDFINEKLLTQSIDGGVWIRYPEFKSHVQLDKHPIPVLVSSLIQQNTKETQTKQHKKTNS